MGFWIPLIMYFLRLIVFSLFAYFFFVNLVIISNKSINSKISWGSAPNGDQLCAQPNENESHGLSKFDCFYFCQYWQTLLQNGMGLRKTSQKCQIQIWQLQIVENLFISKFPDFFDYWEFYSIENKTRGFTLW